jgi:uncharacterized membrane protein
VGALAYLFGLVSGLILLAIEKDSNYVRFHAAQSTVVFGAVLVLNLMLLGTPVVGWLLLVPFLVAVVILWVFLMFKAVSGERYRLPYVGEFAERQLV